MVKSMAKFLGILSLGRFMNKVREEHCRFLIRLCQWFDCFISVSCLFILQEIKLFFMRGKRLSKSEHMMKKLYT